MTSSILLKQKQVSELSEKIKNSKTLMIVSIKSLPSKQFNEIKKSIREHALIKIAKKNIMLRAIKKLEKDSVLGLEKYIQADYAFVISDIEGFELAGILSKKKTPVFAKAGQTATDDIEIKAGPTDLVPGPAISDLGSLGIQIAVEEGKISIKASKVVVNKGQEINENVASLLQKLNIQPFNIGLEPLVIYDVKDEKIYTDINIDSEAITEDLKIAASKALGFAQKIVYYCKDTIGYLLSKANVEGGKLDELTPKEEIKKETSEEQKTEDIEIKESKEENDEVVKEKSEEEGKEEKDNAQLNKPEETL